jgi:AcrR family transcriptional regulator
MAHSGKPGPFRSRRKPASRPPGQSSRSAILDAARSLFARQGFEGTTIRAIASDARVDPALVMQSYGTKDGLFEAVIQETSKLTEGVFAAMAGPRAGVGARVARAYLQLWEDPVTGDAMRSLFRAALGSQRASSLVRRHLTGKVRRTGVPEEKRLGLALAASLLLGTVVGRHLIGDTDLAAAPLEELVGRIAPAIDRYLETRE